MEIKSISKNIFRTSPNKVENKSSHSNPFGVNFKGNMICADVFESTSKTNMMSKLSEKVSNRSKMVVSTIVGSINSMNQNISSRLNSIVSFGRRIRENTARIGRYLNETKLVLNIGLNECETGNASRWNGFENINYSVKNLKKRSTEDLGKMLEEAISARV